jgi:N-acetylneuraminic acid mutarotase
MNKLAISLFLFAFSFALRAQTLNFQTLANMNLKRGAIAYCADGTDLFVANGFTPAGITNVIEKYNISTNTWSNFATSLSAKLYPSSVIVGDSLYLFNGNFTHKLYNNKMEVVNLSTGAVTYSTDNPNPAAAAGSAVWNKDIYVFGGSIDSVTYTNKVYKFNVTTQTWTRLADMPDAKQTKGEIINGKLYVIGGYNGRDSKRIDMYDIATDTWTNRLMLTDSMSAHSTAVFGSKIYILGDYNRETHVASYDVNTNTYTVLSEANWVGRRNAGAVVVKGILYSMGGNTISSTASALSSVQMVNLLTTGIESANLLGMNIFPLISLARFQEKVSKCNW